MTWPLFDRLVTAIVNGIGTDVIMIRDNVVSAMTRMKRLVQATRCINACAYPDKQKISSGSSALLSCPRTSQCRLFAGSRVCTAIWTVRFNTAVVH